MDAFVWNNIIQASKVGQQNLNKTALFIANNVG
jgi:hypothetical protein